MLFGLLGWLLGQCFGVSPGVDEAPVVPESGWGGGWDSWSGDSDTEPYSGPTTLDDYKVDCDETRWWADVWSRGPMSSATLTVSGTVDGAAWVETHPFDGAAEDHDPSGWWSNYYLELSRVSDTALVEPGESSAFACTSTQEGLTFALSITGPDSSDCAVWGADPDSLAEICAP